MEDEYKRQVPLVNDTETKIIIQSAFKITVSADWHISDPDDKLGCSSCRSVNVWRWERGIRDTGKKNLDLRSSIIQSTYKV